MTAAGSAGRPCTKAYPLLLPPSPVLASYFDRVRTAYALAQRGPSVAPAVRRLAVPLTLDVAIYIGLALLLVPGDEAPAFHFVDERGAVTALSALFLAAGAAFAFATYWLSEGADRSVRLLWLTAAAVLAVLVLDELLEFHERVGVALDPGAARRRASGGGTTSW